MRAFPIYEFLLLISPPKPVSRFVSLQKKKLYKYIGEYEGFSSLAHITLANFRDRHNDSKLYDIEPLIYEFSSFELCAKGVKIFKHGLNSTICLDIVHKNPVMDLAEALNKKKITPHITYARNLKPGTFEIALELLQSEDFYDYFHCSYVTVLKRPVYSNSWDNYMKLDLKTSFSR